MMWTVRCPATCFRTCPVVCCDVSMFTSTISHPHDFTYVKLKGTKTNIKTYMLNLLDLFCSHHKNLWTKLWSVLWFSQCYQISISEKIVAPKQRLSYCSLNYFQPRQLTKTNLMKLTLLAFLQSRQVVSQTPVSTFA